MAGIEITMTELVWPGKYNEDGTRLEMERVNLPIQIMILEGQICRSWQTLWRRYLRGKKRFH